MNFLLNICLFFLRVGDHNYVAKSETIKQLEYALVKVKHIISPIHPEISLPFNTWW